MPRVENHWISTGTHVSFDGEATRDPGAVPGTSTILEQLPNGAALAIDASNAAERIGVTRPLESRERHGVKKIASS